MSQLLLLTLSMPTSLWIPLLQSCKQTEVRQTIHCTNDSSKVGGTTDISNQSEAPPTGSNHLHLVVHMYLLFALVAQATLYYQECIEMVIVIDPLIHQPSACKSPVRGWTLTVQ